MTYNKIIVKNTMDFDEQKNNEIIMMFSAIEDKYENIKKYEKQKKYILAWYHANKVKILLSKRESYNISKARDVIFKLNNGISKIRETTLIKYCIFYNTKTEKYEQY